MRSILGQTTPEGNITRGTSSPVKQALQANHCRCRRRARPGREEVRGVRLFLLFFLFRLDEEDALLRRSCSSSARSCAHHGSLFASSRSAFSCASFFFLAFSFSFSSSSLFLSSTARQTRKRCAVNAVATSKHRDSKERTRGSHVTDRGCLPMHLWLLQDARVRTS